MSPGGGLGDVLHREFPTVGCSGIRKRKGGWIGVRESGGGTPLRGWGVQGASAGGGLGDVLHMASLTGTFPRVECSGLRRRQRSWDGVGENGGRTPIRGGGGV